MRVWSWVGLAAAAAGAAGELTQDGPDSVQQPTDVDDPAGAGLYNGAWSVNYELTDEFDANTQGVIDAAKWQTSFPGWNGMQPGAFSPANVAEGNGMLVIAAQAEPDYDFPSSTDDCGCSYNTITTGVLYSLAATRFGYYEVRAKTAKIDGLQSGFFLQGTQSEIAGLEANGRDPVVNVTHHCFTQTASTGHTSGHELGDDDAFHTFGIRVMPRQVTYFVDGAQVATSQSGAALCTNDDHHLVLDLETVLTPTSSIEAVVGASAEEAAFTIDYVRAWSFDDGCPGPVGFFHPAEYGRLRSTSQHSLGDDVSGLTKWQCARKCEADASCMAFEYLPSTERCNTRSRTGRDVGLVNFSSIIWETYDRRATRCADATCRCAEFEFEVDTTTTPATTTAAAVSSCSLAEQFSTPIASNSMGVLKDRWYYQASSRRAFAASPEECQRHCVRFGRGCKAVEYSAVKGVCHFKTIRGSGLRYTPSCPDLGFESGCGRTKPNARFNLWNRHTICDRETLPEDKCVVNHPLNLFAPGVPQTKMRGKQWLHKGQTWTPADCAARCLAWSGPEMCHFFTHQTTFQACVLWGAEDFGQRTSAPHTFYARDLTGETCDRTLGNTPLQALVLPGGTEGASPAEAVPAAYAAIALVALAAVGAVVMRRGQAAVKRASGAVGVDAFDEHTPLI